MQLLIFKLLLTVLRPFFRLNHTGDSRLTELLNTFAKGLSTRHGEAPCGNAEPHILISFGVDLLLLTF